MLRADQRPRVQNKAQGCRGCRGGGHGARAGAGAGSSGAGSPGQHHSGVPPALPRHSCNELAGLGGDGAGAAGLGAVTPGPPPAVVPRGGDSGAWGRGRYARTTRHRVFWVQRWGRCCPTPACPTSACPQVDEGDTLCVPSTRGFCPPAGSSLTRAGKGRASSALPTATAAPVPAGAVRGGTWGLKAPSPGSPPVSAWPHGAVPARDTLAPRVCTRQGRVHMAQLQGTGMAQPYGVGTYGTATRVRDGVARPHGTWAVWKSYAGQGPQRHSHI